MGMSMRTGQFLKLDLPSMIWKPLVQSPVTPLDLAGVDILSAQILDHIRSLCDMTVTRTPEQIQEEKTAFERLHLTFTVIGSDKKTYNLGHYAPNTHVTWDKRHQYLRLLQQYRLNEFSVQCAAIRRGLATVVPYAVLSLFTAEELEAEVVGMKTIDVDYLEANTEYEGCSSSDPHIRFFWAVMRTRFDDDQRAKLLRFVWGRSRLPLPGENWERKFKIASHSRSQRGGANRVDLCLPESHTCFFTLDLPRYSTLEITYEKILFAIINCLSVDGDGSLNHGGADMNAESDDEDL